MAVSPRARERLGAVAAACTFEACRQIALALQRGAHHEAAQLLASALAEGVAAGPSQEQHSPGDLAAQLELELCFLQAELCLQRGAPGEAEHWLQVVLERQPQHGWSHYLRAALLLQRQVWSEAASAFEQARLLLPDQDWIEPLARQCRQMVALQSEKQKGGGGSCSYSYWLRHHEPALPGPLQPLDQGWWLLEEQSTGGSRAVCRWRALHSEAAVLACAPADPLGPWPRRGWLVLLGPGVQLRPGALQAIEHWLAGAGRPLAPQMLYADEDRLDAAGHRHDPWFKPDWVEESFWSTPWLQAFSAWQLDWLRDCQLPLPPADPLQRFAWQLRALEAGPRIAHVPLVLSHDSPADGPGGATGWSRAARRRAARELAAHLRRRGEAIRVVRPHPREAWGFELHWQPPRGQRCTIIIPTRDRADLLDRCLTGVAAAMAAVAEILPCSVVVIDNGSREPTTAALLADWQQRLGDRLRVRRDERPFNWSALNNAVALQADSELLLFLNNDIEAPSPATPWLARLAAQALRPRVGCAGALLTYPNGTIQHAGIVVAMQGGANHAYRHLRPDHPVHRGRSRLHTAWSGVTGACLMVRRELFLRVGGFEDALPVEGNDLDFCLRLGELGYRHVIDPSVQLVHHENATRGDERQSATLRPALRWMQRRWPERLRDPAPWWPPAASPDWPDGRPRGLEALL